MSIHTRMVRLEGEERAALRSIASAGRKVDVADVIRLDWLGGWPSYEVIGREDDDVLVLRPTPLAHVNGTKH